MATRPQAPPADAAHAFLEAADFVWHQRFELVPGVFTPGVSDIGWLLTVAGLPLDLSGQTVLDIGTSNGGAAFIAERRGAKHVVAVDIFSGDRFGVLALRDFLHSQIHFVRGSVYELPSLLDESFDIVLMFGVLYHLRHPLLALDAVRSRTRGVALIETAVADHELGPLRDSPLVRFYEGDELGGDASNWFAPSVTAFIAWCASSGWIVELLGVWPEESPERCIVRAYPDARGPAFERISYERGLRVAGHAAITE